MKKVLIPTKLKHSAIEILFTKNYTVIKDFDTPLKELIGKHRDTEVLIVRSEKIKSDIIDMLPQLELIIRAGAGYDNIDTAYARSKNIDVMNTPGANSNAVAEEVIAMYLATSRFLIQGDITTRQGLWEKKNFMGSEISYKTVGIVGLGNIGKLVAKRLQGFEVKLLAYDPFISASYAQDLNIEIVSIEDIFKRSDCVTLHIPETKESKGIVNKRLLETMKDGAVLINCARSGIINEEDLREVKKNKRILFCNDVYEKDEPGIKSVTDIADIMLPHLGANTHEANFNAAKRAAEQVVDYYENGVTKCVINKDLPDGLDRKYQILANVISKIGMAYLENNSLHQIITTFYGDLNHYSDWLIGPIINGICPNYSNQILSASNAVDFLKEKGIILKNRVDVEDRGYGESMTIDIFAGNETITKMSIRGTITEGNIMISRINDYNKLYLDPNGNNLFIEYEDGPGIIGKIASCLGRHNININEIRAPQDFSKKFAILALKTDIEISELIISEIKKEVPVKHVFFVKI